ncbi:MAG: SH3 domain-containing protein [Devosia sp.]|uniref:SH3 domain-containing protein n=1 Tax=Devosia sp. TaxID=1871048 RepID=UPI0024C6395F|nr:SH3 domain-containing protein [Devosia sp.]UYN99203.1 MAG: SH3 domain-containing protein [Devosia sp.]
MFKKTLIAAALVLATASGAMAADWGWTTGGINFREGPGTSYYKLGTIPACTKVSITESQNGWYKVQWSGRWGWVASRYVSYDADYCTTYKAPSYSRGY